MEKKKEVLFLNGEFNQGMIFLVKSKLRSMVDGITTIRVNSIGGDVHVMNIISAFFYYLIKYKKNKVVFQIVYADSAALMLAVNFPIRLVTKDSKGSIHLPVAAEGENPSAESQKKKYNEAVDFYQSKTNLSREEIISLDGKLLDAQQMLEARIATELVEDFDA